ncbi:MAG: sigma-54-dependent transcriptional regulator [Syntrophales bacterium]
MANILIVDDDQLLCDGLAVRIADIGHQVLSSYTLTDALEKVSAQSIDVVYLDVHMPDGNGLEALETIRNLPTPPEVIIMTGRGDADGAELAINNGAWDYIEKPFSLNEMILPLTRAIKYREAVSIRKPKRTLYRAGIVGSSAAMTLCLDQVAQAADSSANVLITGETGTGKELLAWAIHRNSPMSGKNFVVVDCASLTDTLVESMLFGHEKGAYTGADKASEGLIKQADGGTLFLDEVGELPLAIQKGFLRVLQERRFRPLGSSHEVESHFRLIAATNRDLDEMTGQGLFRNDLLYRLRSFTIQIPPLRKRPDDIAELARHYMTRLSERYGIPVKDLSPDVQEALLRYEWPGNVRELVLTLERVIAVAKQEATIFLKHLPTNIRIKVAQTALARQQKEPETVGAEGSDVDSAPSAGACPPESPESAFPTLQEVRDRALDKAEEEYLKDLLSVSGHKIAVAARLSGLSRSRLYELLRRRGMSISL